MDSRVVVVTRYLALVEHLMAIGLIEEGVPVLAHARWSRFGGRMSSGILRST